MCFLSLINWGRGMVWVFDRARTMIRSPRLVPQSRPQHLHRPPRLQCWMVGGIQTRLLLVKHLHRHNQRKANAGPQRCPLPQTWMHSFNRPLHNRRRNKKTRPISWPCFDHRPCQCNNRWYVQRMSWCVSVCVCLCGCECI